PSVSATGTYLQCLTCHRHLHSFPTRRSSDLGIVTDAFTDGHKHIPEQTGINIRFGHHTHANRILPFFRMQVGHQLPIQVDIEAADRKSTRLNSSHVKISYAVFCLKKKTTIEQ